MKILWECEHCGKLIPYMYYFCNECTEKLLGEAPKPFKPPIENKEEQLEKLKAEIEYAKFCCALEEERNK